MIKVKNIFLLIILGLFFAYNAYSLDRVKIWVDGEILTHTDLNAEFDNVVDAVPVVYQPDYLAVDQGATGNSNTTKYCVDTIGTTNKATIYYRHNSGLEYTDYTFLTSDDYTANTNIKFVFENGARLAVGNGITVTINGPFEVGLAQAFVCTGTGKVVFGTGSVKEVYPEWWGVDGTADEVQIQKANDAIVDSGSPGMLSLSSKTYTMAAGVTINVGYVSIKGNRAVLNFSAIGDVPAITLKGGNPVGTSPYNQADAQLSGFKIIGPTNAAATGLYFNQEDGGSYMGPAHLSLRNINIVSFKHGVRIGEHSYLITFDGSDIRNCAIGLYHPLTTIGSAAIVDSGENIRFNNGAIYQNVIGFQNDSGSADFSFNGTSFDHNTSIAANVVYGQAAFTDCHFETFLQALVIGNNTFVTCAGNYFNSLTDTQDAFIENNGYLTLIGGRIYAPDNNTNVITSTQRIFLAGTHMQSGSASPTSLSGLYHIHFANTSLITTNYSITPPLVRASVFQGTNTVTPAVVDTWVALGVGYVQGLFVFRDNTSGGVAVFAIDSSLGATSISNTITGFELQYNAGDVEARVTSGAVPRDITFAVMAM